MHTVLVCALWGAVGLNEVVRVSSRGRVEDEPRASERLVNKEPGAEPAAPISNEMDRSNKSSQTSPHLAPQLAEMDRTEEGTLPIQGNPEPDEEEGYEGYFNQLGTAAVAGLRTLADQFRGEKVKTSASDLLSPRVGLTTGLGRGPHGRRQASKKDTHHCCCYYTGADDRGEQFCGDVEQGDGGPEVETAPVILYNGLHACKTGPTGQQCAPGWLEALWSKTMAFPGECIANDLYATDINIKFPFGSEPVRTIEGKWVWSAEVDTCNV